MTVDTANGCTGSAWIDGSGHVVIAFKGTASSAQTRADAEILAGVAADQTPAFADALAFARGVVTKAAAEGIAASAVFVTGFSLGGTLAAYVASKTGLGGASFAGAGVPGLDASSASAASNFTSFVANGDPFANWGSDTAERAVVSSTQAHEGKLVFIGPPSAIGARIVTDVKALTPALFLGQLPQATARLGNDWNAGIAAAHTISGYAKDIAQSVGGAASVARVAHPMQASAPADAHAGIIPVMSW